MAEEETMKVRLIALALVVVAVLALTVGCGGNPETTGSDGLHSTIPPLVGMTLEEARIELREAGYEVGEVTPQRPAPEGAVSQQDPIAGTSAARGTKVNLTIDDGR